MDKKEIIRLLNMDIEAEHGAIIQYLIHAFSMGEGELSCELEGIAREEMRHLDWLAETVVELGGIPSITRGKMRMEGAQVPEWMKNDVLLEEDAITLYREHIQLIDDPKIKRLLGRILSDELSHHGDFEHFVEKSGRENMQDQRGTEKIPEVLDWGIAHEYTVVLQYMFHSYMSKNPEVRKQLEDQAINEMQHLGWLAEEAVDSGGSPVIEHTAVDQSTEPLAMLKADLAVEKQVADGYDRAAKTLTDPGLKKLIERIRDHEVYHTRVFEDLIEQEK